MSAPQYLGEDDAYGVPIQMGDRVRVVLDDPIAGVPRADVGALLYVRGMRYGRVEVAEKHNGQYPWNPLPAHVLGVVNRSPYVHARYFEGDAEPWPTGGRV